jgi:glycosyl transferase family 87
VSQAFADQSYAAMKRALNWSPVALGVLCLGLLAWPQRERAIRGQNDFVSFYTGAKLAGTPDLYSRPANLQTIQSILGFQMEGTTYIRPPFYAILLKPLAALPYRVAWAIFFWATLASILWFVIRFSKECPALPIFASLSIPLMNGQDTPFLLVILGAAILLFRRNRDFAAGLVLSLCALKFHLFLFLALLLVMKRRWRAIKGGACGLAVLALLSWGEIRAWIQVLRDPWISPNPQDLPNLHGLILTLHGGFGAELAVVAIIGVLFIVCVLKSANFEFLMAISLVCGLLASFHSGPADDVLLLPVFVLAIASSKDAITRTLTALVVSPIPYLMSLSGSPYSAALPMLLIVWVIFAVRSVIGGVKFGVEKADLLRVSES